GLRPGPDCVMSGVRATVLAVVVWVALVVWLALVAWSLSVMRAAGASDRPGADPASAPSRVPRAPFAGRRRVIAITQGILLVVAICVAALLSTDDQWKPITLVGLIALLVLGSDILVLDAKRFRIGGSFTGLVLAMALLGPAPAAALGPSSALVDAARPRARGTYLLHNLLTHMTFPLLRGISLASPPPPPPHGGVAPP